MKKQEEKTTGPSRQDWEQIIDSIMVFLGDVDNTVKIMDCAGKEHTVELNIPAVRQSRAQKALTPLLDQLQGSFAGSIPVREATETDEQYAVRINEATGSLGNIIKAAMSLASDELIACAAEIMNREAEEVGNNFTSEELAGVVLPFCLSRLKALGTVAKRTLTKPKS